MSDPSSAAAPLSSAFQQIELQRTAGRHTHTSQLYCSHYKYFDNKLLAMRSLFYIYNRRILLFSIYFFH